jgi:anti-sigma factor ChrR (cupin superfamily)
MADVSFRRPCYGERAYANGKFLSCEDLSVAADVMIFPRIIIEILRREEATL